MAQYKTPGAYIVEENAFPNSIVEVATAVPAFIGYTERAARGSASLTGIPTRISSLAEFQLYFGGAPRTAFNLDYDDGGTARLAVDGNTRFLLYNGLRMFFDNGGGPCWIVSVGDYGTSGTPRVKGSGDFDAVWGALEREQEPTMVVIPEAVLLDLAGYQKVSNAALAHCAKMQSRVAILDVFDGDKARSGGEDVISGDHGFRNVIANDTPSFGIAYYPWVNTNVIPASDIDFTNLTADGREKLQERLADAALGIGLAGDKIADLLSLPTKAGLTAGTTVPDLPALTRQHQTLSAQSADYRQIMADIRQQLNVMPPSAAMAGVIARTDANVGVFKAPANTPIADVLSPCVAISHDEQADLNVPLDGKAINAIRTFMGRGVLVWGARTLDGNSQDWRYVNVRRTAVMLEQSIGIAAQSYVFAPNDAATWLSMRTMIENFLNNQWKAGALAGSKPQDAYEVSVGLGTTMTPVDILDGYMRITVKVAIVHPAEFIVITFQQKMQSS